MNAALHVNSERGNWIRGTAIVDGRKMSVTAKVFPKPSELYGITDEADGRVSKLQVKDEYENLLLDYNREWIHKDEQLLGEEEYGELLSLLEDYAQNELKV